MSETRIMEKQLDRYLMAEDIAVHTCSICEGEIYEGDEYNYNTQTGEIICKDCWRDYEQEEWERQDEDDRREFLFVEKRKAEIER